MLTIFFIFIFGLSIGSFLNVVICRLHVKESIFCKRSFCPHCKHTLGVLDLVPVLSFIFLKGRCRYCRKKISWQYPAVELATALLFSFAYLKYFNLFGWPRYGDPAILSLEKLAAIWFFISTFIIVFVYDLKHYLILDSVVLPAALLALAANLFFKMPFWNIVLGGALAAGFFLLQFLISRGKWIGGGDIKLGLLMGFLLGWPHILIALFLAYFLGSVVGLGLVFFGRKGLKSELPFGTFLSVAAIVTMFYGEKILGWYLGLVR